MSTLTSIPIPDPKRFLELQDHYKGELTGDMRLEEASALAARRQLLLENPKVDADWALPQVKAMSRKLNRLTRRIREPFGSAPPTHNMFPEDVDNDFAAGPVQALAQRLVSPLINKRGTATPIKTPPNKKPVKRRDPLSPKVTPSTRKAKKKAKQKFRGHPSNTQTRPKATPEYRPELGTPIPFNPDTPSTSGAPQGKAHSWLQTKAKSSGKKAATAATKKAGKGFAKWLGWTK